jgi:PDDEXK-like domain of unknown function (DUF3799)
MKAPARCEGCGHSSRHTRQLDGEVPEYQACCEKWFCAACREQRGCTGVGDHTPLPNAAIAFDGVPLNDGIYSPMALSETVYHSDLTSLSSSGARALTNGTPEQFDYDRKNKPKTKRHYDFGHAAHKMVLGQGAELGILDPAVHGLTADGKPSQKPTATGMWKAAEAALRDQGKTVITKEQLKQAQVMAGKVFAHPLAAKLLAQGRAEHSIYWHDDPTGARLRIRFDWLTELGRPICCDYKTAVSASKNHFRKAVFDYGYHQQQAFYEDGLAEIGLEDVGFLFIVQQKDPPHAVGLYTIDPDDVERGRQLNRRAIEVFAECSRTGNWPGIPPIIQQVSAKPWEIAATEELLAQ